MQCARPTRSDELTLGDGLGSAVSAAVGDGVGACVGGIGSRSSSTLFEGLPRGTGSSAAAFAVRRRGGMGSSTSRRLAAATRGFGFRGATRRVNAMRLHGQRAGPWRVSSAAVGAQRLRVRWLRRVRRSTQAGSLVSYMPLASHFTNCQKAAHYSAAGGVELL